MALVDALSKLHATVAGLGEILQSVSTQPIKIAVTTSGSSDDRTDAEAIKRGQKPETLAALRRAL